MGTLSFQIREQQIIFSEVASHEYFREHFYFTGGTALIAYYLNHRYSDDLDFFSEKQFDNQVILTLMHDWSKKYHFTFQSRFVEVVYIFNLRFSNGVVLKVDFSYYPHKRVQIGDVVEGMPIDSLNDIAINKLVTISQGNNVRDFVDLYFLLPKFGLWDLIYGVKQKFHMDIERMLLASDFLKVEDFDTMPRMIKPLPLDELKVFYREQAKMLGKEAVE